MISFFVLIFSESILNFESGTYPLGMKSYISQLSGWILIVSLVKTAVYVISLMVIYEELEALIELSMYPIRNIKFLNIAMFDILIPFFLSAICNAMCDT